MHAIVLWLAMHRGIRSSSEGRVNGGAVEAVVLVMARTGRGWRRRVGTRSSRCVTLGDLSSVGGCSRRSGRGYRDLMRRRIGCWLDLRRAGLLLENGIVAQALALALLAIPADRVGFVALANVVVSKRI